MRGMRLQVQCTPHRTVPSHRPASRSPGRGRPLASHSKLRRVQLWPGQAPAGSPCELRRRHQGRATATAAHARPGMVVRRRATRSSVGSSSGQAKPRPAASASCGVGTRATPPQPPHTLARAWSPAGEPPEGPSGPAPASQAKPRPAASASCGVGMGLFEIIFKICEKSHFRSSEPILHVEKCNM
jgi:hypothetical protein